MRSTTSATNRNPDYWLRMSAVEDRLIDYYLANRGTELGKLCWDKAQDLNDRYDTYHTMTKREYGRW